MSEAPGNVHRPLLKSPTRPWLAILLSADSRSGWDALPIGPVGHSAEESRVRAVFVLTADWYGAASGF